MTELRVTLDQAKSILLAVEHEVFQSASKNHWGVDARGNVRGQSVCWIFCWASTGMGSDKAKKEVRGVFETILDVSFDHFNKKVGLKWARHHRYVKGDIESELSALLR